MHLSSHKHQRFFFFQKGGRVCVCVCVCVTAQVHNDRRYLNIKGSGEAHHCLPSISERQVWLVEREREKANENKDRARAAEIYKDNFRVHSSVKLSDKRCEAWRNQDRLGCKMLIEVGLLVH